MSNLSMQAVYDAYQTIRDAREAERRLRTMRLTSLQRFLGVNPGARAGPAAAAQEQCGGFKRIERCREALEALDRQGWNRSYHQREFHDHFIRACARIFWKTEKPGAFARDHQRILEVNGWASLSQEVLISTPRRFGKTISVSMFAAAMLYSTPNLEMSIYSTCKRISQKLLRNVYKFLGLIHLELGVPRMKEIRMNFEEIVLQGHDSPQDVRIVNSYPSKVGSPRAPPADSRKCSCVIVSTLHSLAMRAARWKRFWIRSSLASCSACRVELFQSRSDLRSWPSSRTRREKAARGKARVFFLRWGARRRRSAGAAGRAEAVGGGMVWPIRCRPHPHPPLVPVGLARRFFRHRPRLLPAHPGLGLAEAADVGQGQGTQGDVERGLDPRADADDTPGDAVGLGAGTVDLVGERDLGRLDREGIGEEVWRGRGLHAGDAHVLHAGLAVSADPGVDLAQGLEWRPEVEHRPELGGRRDGRPDLIEHGHRHFELLGRHADAEALQGGAGEADGPTPRPEALGVLARLERKGAEVARVAREPRVHAPLVEAKLGALAAGRVEGVQAAHRDGGAEEARQVLPRLDAHAGGVRARAASDHPGGDARLLRDGGVEEREELGEGQLLLEDRASLPTGVDRVHADGEDGPVRPLVEDPDAAGALEQAHVDRPRGRGVPEHRKAVPAQVLHLVDGLAAVLGGGLHAGRGPAGEPDHERDVERAVPKHVLRPSKERRGLVDVLLRPCLKHLKLR